jgi:hypothetical protein
MIVAHFITRQNAAVKMTAKSEPRESSNLITTKLRSSRAWLFGYALPLTLACLNLPSARAAGPIGVDGGWVIDNSGNCLLTPSLCSAYTGLTLALTPSCAGRMQITVFTGRIMSCPIVGVAGLE